MNVPEKWTLPAFGASQTALGKSIVFGCRYFETFTLLIRPLNPQPSPEQTENEFKRYVKDNDYTSLEFGRIIVEGQEHIWARYYEWGGKWTKKYLVVISGIEYAFTATCFYQSKLLERECVWDEVIKSFHIKATSVDAKWEPDQQVKDDSNDQGQIIVEPRGVLGQSAEAEYAIEHPLIGKQSQNSDTVRALNLFYESARCLQDGKEQKGLALYQEAMRVDPSLHTHACDALTNMAQSCNPEDAGAIYYWLGIHSEYLKDDRQALIWYEKAIDAFHQIGYPKREGRAHCNLGKAKMRLEDPSGMEEFEKAIALNPMDGIAHIDIGTAYYITDEYEQALDAFAEAIWADPNRYSPLVISRLQRFGYTWQEDIQKIGKRVAKKQGIDFDTLTTSDQEDLSQANQYFEIGNGFFHAGRYLEALEQFEKGKLLSKKFTGNYLGVSMTAMQMIEVGAIPEDQIPLYLEKAEQNIDECLRIVPNHPDYLETKNKIREVKKKYHVP